MTEVRAWEESPERVDCGQRVVLLTTLVTRSRWRTQKAKGRPHRGVTRKLSPGSRSGLSLDSGCREIPGVSCPDTPTFRSREGTPRPPFRSIRPGFSAGETVRTEGRNECLATLTRDSLGGPRCRLQSPPPHHPGDPSQPSSGPQGGSSGFRTITISFHFGVSKIRS